MLMRSGWYGFLRVFFFFLAFRDGGDIEVWTTTNGKDFLNIVQ